MTMPGEHIQFGRTSRKAAKRQSHDKGESGQGKHFNRQADPLTRGPMPRPCGYPFFPAFALLPLLSLAAWRLCATLCQRVYAACRWHPPRHPEHFNKGRIKVHRPRPSALQRVRRSDCRDVEKLPAHHLTQQKTSPSHPRIVTPRVRMAAVGLGKSYRRSRVPYPMLAVSTAAWGRSTFPATFLTTMRLSATTMSEEGITLKRNRPPGASCL